MKKQLLFFLGILFSVSLYSQGVLTPFKEWSTTAGTQNFFHKSIMKTDGSGFIYLAGATINGSGNYDAFVTKTSPNGTLLWAQQYNGLSNFQDAATDLYIDASGNVYITGFVTNDTVTFLSDVITIKYNSSGVQQWVATYNGSGSMYDGGAFVFEDGSGNVYVGGSSMNTSANRDVLAIKYNSSGTQQWAREYNGASGLDDAAFKGAIAAGQLSVGSVSQTASTSYVQLALKLNLSTGAVISATYVTSSSSGTDLVNDVEKDASGNIYIVGGKSVAGNGYDLSTIKISAGGIIQWEVDYNSASSLDDVAEGVQVDASGNVYTTGYTTSSTGQKDMITIKYNSSGTQQWLVTYNDTLNGNDVANAIVLDASNNVYVTGYDSTALNWNSKKKVDENCLALCHMF